MNEGKAMPGLMIARDGVSLDAVPHNMVVAKDRRLIGFGHGSLK